jgi:hypothetical protein
VPDLASTAKHTREIRYALFACEADRPTDRPGLPILPQRTWSCPKLIDVLEETRTADNLEGNLQEKWSYARSHACLSSYGYKLRTNRSSLCSVCVEAMASESELWRGKKGDGVASLCMWIEFRRCATPLRLHSPHMREVTCHSVRTHRALRIPHWMSWSTGGMTRMGDLA